MFSLASRKNWSESRDPSAIAPVGYPNHRHVLRLIAMLALLILNVAGSQAEPLNVLIGDLTFARPEKWRWEPAPTNTVAQTSFILPDTAGETSPPIVLFFLSLKNSAEAIEAWKTRFPDMVNTREVHPGEKTINDRSLTYYGLNGYYSFKRERISNHTLFGAIIPTGDKFVHVLLIGSAASVLDAIPEFKLMIENAMEEAE